MRTHRLAVFAVFVLAATQALAQTPTAPAAPAKPPAVTTAPPPPPPAPPAPGTPRQPINIRVDTTISESGGNTPAVKKTVTAVAGDGFDASVRETATTTVPPVGGPPPGPTSLNVDASPTILSNGRIRVRVTLQYAAGQAQPTEQRVRTDIRQTLVLNLENGKPLVISEASDPLSDRRVTVEVTATILK
jgi:hypothetical protein